MAKKLIFLFAKFRLVLIFKTIFNAIDSLRHGFIYQISVVCKFWILLNFIISAEYYLFLFRSGKYAFILVFLKEIWYNKKLVHEISLKVPELLIIDIYVKIRFENRGLPCYFLSSRGQKIKNITKIEQKLIYTINIWFNFVSGPFNFLNKIIY